MGNPILLLTLALLGVCFTRNCVAEAPVSADAQWSMSLDANGNITSLAIKPGRVKDVLREQLEAAILEWKFEPGAVNGEPAATETSLHVRFTVALNAAETGYDVKIDDVDTGATVKSMEMPKYPLGGGFREVGLVLLELAYDEQGRVLTVAVAESSPIKKGRLLSSAIYSVKKWTFEPERVAGHGVSGRTYQPICYQTNIKQADCSWTPPDSDEPTTSDRSVALDSRVRLKSDVVGKTI